MTQDNHKLLGLLAEFEEPEDLLRAARETTEAGYRRFEAYAPHSVEGIAEAMSLRPTRMPLLVLIGGAIGACGGFGLQYWASAVQWPLNVGGRPPNSWPMFIPVTFECTVLIASLFCVLGMLALNGLPRPHHPLFDVPGFERASQDRFFVFIQSRDPKFDVAQTRELLEGFEPVRVSDVLRK